LLKSPLSPFSLSDVAKTPSCFVPPQRPSFFSLQVSLFFDSLSALGLATLQTQPSTSYPPPFFFIRQETICHGSSTASPEIWAKESLLLQSTSQFLSSFVCWRPAVTDELLSTRRAPFSLRLPQSSFFKNPPQIGFWSRLSLFLVLTLTPSPLIFSTWVSIF